MGNNLGKGLGALISQDDDSNEKLKTIKIEYIKPNKDQPRKEIDDTKLDELMKSIKAHGIIQPIIVRKASQGYEIVAGERRWKAAMNLGLKEVPAIVKEISKADMSKMAIVENIQREDLNSIDEAFAYKDLIDEYSLTQSEVSEIVGKSRSYITNLLRLLKLNSKVIEAIKDDLISSGHGKALLSLNDENKQIEVLNKIVNNSYSVRKTERYIKKLKSTNNKNKKSRKKSRKPKEIVFYENDLEQKFNTKVNINHKKNNKGKIEIEYYNLEDLNRLLEIL
ncbi:MAG: ParB/RepB/Spo0J family partition protein [Bacillota bacterium]